MEHSTDTLDRIARALETVRPIVAGIRDDQWDDPTPCAGWTVRDLVNHLVGGLRIFAAELGGREPEAEHESDWLGDDAVASLGSAADLDRAAWMAPGALSRTVSISLGRLPASFAAVIHLVELVEHGVDLAVATGQQHLLDEDLCRDLLGLLVEMGGVDAYRVPGVFGPQVPVADDAPAHERLAGYLGRTIDGPAAAEAAAS